MSTPPGETAAFSAGVEAQGANCAGAEAGDSRPSAAVSSAASFDPAPNRLLPIAVPFPAIDPQTPRVAGAVGQGGGRLADPLTVTFVRLSALSCLYSVVIFGA